MTQLTIPKELQKMLPFKDTPKILQQKKDPLRRVAVIREPHEVKVCCSDIFLWYIPNAVNWIPKKSNSFLIGRYIGLQIKQFDNLITFHSFTNIFTKHYKQLSTRKLFFGILTRQSYCPFPTSLSKKKEHLTSYLKNVVTFLSNYTALVSDWPRHYWFYP